MKKYEFTSIFKQEFYDFVQLRNNQGYADRNVFILYRFDSLLNSVKLTDKALAPELIDRFIAKQDSGIHTNSVINYVKYVRQFAKYLQTLEITAFMPDYPIMDKTYIPYIFTEQEISDILSAADNIQPRGNTIGRKILRIQFPMLLRLLYCCGLRLGEALSLSWYDVDWDNAVFLIKDGKGNKDRLVPFDMSLSEILKQYHTAIRANNPECRYVFENYNGKPRPNGWAEWWFSKILADTKIVVPNLPPHSRNICLHCLRHSFAVHSFRKQDLAGIDNYRATPPLSVYLGHDKLLGTQKYLHMTDETAEDIWYATRDIAKRVFPEVPQ